jgi:hypothetical protein
MRVPITQRPLAHGAKGLAVPPSLAGCALQPPSREAVTGPTVMPYYLLAAIGYLPDLGHPLPGGFRRVPVGPAFSRGQPSLRPSRRLLVPVYALVY